MTEPRTEAGRKLLRDLTSGGPHLIGPGHWKHEIARIEAEAAVGVHLGDEGLRGLSEAASPDWTVTNDGTIAVMVREGPGGAQIGNFVCIEDAEFAVAAVNYVRAALAAQENPETSR